MWDVIIDALWFAMTGSVLVSIFTLWRYIAVGKISRRASAEVLKFQFGEYRTADQRTRLQIAIGAIGVSTRWNINLVLSTTFMLICILVHAAINDTSLHRMWVATCGVGALVLVPVNIYQMTRTLRVHWTLQCSFESSIDWLRDRELVVDTYYRYKRVRFMYVSYVSPIDPLDIQTVTVLEESCSTSQ